VRQALSTLRLRGDRSVDVLVRRAMLMGRARKAVLPLTGFVGVIVIWWAVVEVLYVPAFIVPSPASVLQALADKRETLLVHAQYTAVVIVAGFLISVAVAVPLALVIAFSRTLSAIVYPLIVSTQAVPKVALAPLILMWLGFGPRGGILVTVLISFFPVVVDTVLGLKAMPDELHYLALSMGAGRWRTFIKMRVPFALPFLFSGMKIAITLAVVGAVVGEFVGSNQGLGYYLLVASANARTADVFADVFVLSLLAVSLFGLMQLLERIVIPSPRKGSR
jgi:NitT/TauT family transport system permease protein